MGKTDGRSKQGRVASLDIGTNSIRLLVAERADQRGITRVFGDRRIVRLGEGLTGARTLSDTAMERALRALKLFVSEAGRWEVRRINAGATWALRWARNSQDFILKVRDSLGLEVRVLSEEQEAQCMARGLCLLWGSAPSNWLALDIGGGSTEVVWVEGESPRWYTSIPLGMVGLTDEYLQEGIPSDDCVNECQARIRELLRGHLSEIEHLRGDQLVLVGTAGTIATLSSMDQGLSVYRPELINGYSLPISRVARWRRRLQGLSPKDRASIPGLERGREDVILAGVLILEEVMRWFETPQLISSDYGLLEGLALEALSQ